jgi:hypothetical protein
MIFETDPQGIFRLMVNRWAVQGPEPAGYMQEVFVWMAVLDLELSGADLLYKHRKAKYFVSNTIYWPSVNFLSIKSQPAKR